MDFSVVLRERREELKLGVRATARLTERPFVPFPIKSAIYISRLENKVEEEMRAEAVSIDKLWALGVALKIHPLTLFAYSRNMPELIDHIPLFALQQCETCDFATFIKAQRKRHGLTLQSVEKISLSVSPWPISPSYLSQIETNFEKIAEKVQAEKLWSLGRILNIDPLLMYVLSRGIEDRYLNPLYRNTLFT